jgi:hypothetical protein
MLLLDLILLCHTEFCEIGLQTRSLRLFGFDLYCIIFGDLLVSFWDLTACLRNGFLVFTGYSFCWVGFVCFEDY